MIEWYLSVRDRLCSIEGKARDALVLFLKSGKEASDGMKRNI
jgi:hypothetical protein